MPLSPSQHLTYVYGRLRETASDSAIKRARTAAATHSKQTHSWCIFKCFSVRVCISFGEVVWLGPHTITQQQQQKRKKERKKVGPCLVCPLSVSTCLSFRAPRVSGCIIYLPYIYLNNSISESLSAAHRFNKFECAQIANYLPQLK